MAGASNFVDRSIVAVEVLVGVGVVAAIVGKSYGPATTVVFVVAGLSVAFTVYVVARMLTALSDPSLDVTGRVEDEHRAALEHEKLLILQGIKELEADAAVGKVDAADYQHLRQKSEADALRIIRELREDDDKWLARAKDEVRRRLGANALPSAKPPVEAEAPAAPEQTFGVQVAADVPRAIDGVFDDRPVQFAADTHACDACETVNPADAHFCVGCGRPRAPEERAA